ncbi:MAG: hypothetical protein Q8P52_03255, partial [bacterium]|nr:hypothetical protein [bacterium]
RDHKEMSYEISTARDIIDDLTLRLSLHRSQNSFSSGNTGQNISFSAGPFSAFFVNLSDADKNISEDISDEITLFVSLNEPIVVQNGIPAEINYLMTVKDAQFVVGGYYYKILAEVFQNQNKLGEQIVTTFIPNY